MFIALRMNSSLRSFTRNFSTRSFLQNSAPKSSCSAGTILNLKIKKNGDEPTALEDHEYPEWLWDCLDKEKMDQQLKEADFMKWRRKQITKANTKLINNNNFLAKMKG